MQDQLEQLIDELIRIELNMAELYAKFSEDPGNDTVFWKKLHEEEIRHAAILKAGRDVLYEFPKELLPKTLEELTKVNNRVISCIKEQEKRPFSREVAFRTALSLEESAGEAHFQRVMEGFSGAEILGIFRELNDGDKDHAQRIRNRMDRLS